MPGRQAASRSQLHALLMGPRAINRAAVCLEMNQTGGASRLIKENTQNIEGSQGVVLLSPA